MGGGKVKSFSRLLIAGIVLAMVPLSGIAQDSSPQAMTLQEAINGYESVTNGHVGFPEDWTTHHVVFSRPAPGSAAYDRVTHDPRYWIQEIRRLRLQTEASVQADLQTEALISNLTRRWRRRHRKAKMHRDWSVSLGSGGTEGAEMYPAKFSFDAGGTKNCATDFVVFNTSLGGSVSQASIVGIGNLYSGCGGTVPTVSWAYNTGGTARTSPVLSLDGTQVAFVQSEGSVAHLILLKWNPGPSIAGAWNDGHLSSGNTTITSATVNFTANDVGARISGADIPVGTYIAAVANSTTATLSQAATGTTTNEVFSISFETVDTPGVPPTAASASAYRSCTAPCMLDIPFSGNPNDTNSAPFVYYFGDTLFVAANNGTLHKFTGVFLGTPAESSSPWPITVNSGKVISSPVFDETSNEIFVGDATGQVSAVAASSGTLTTNTTLLSNSNPVNDAPLLDGTTEKVFWFGGANGSNKASTIFGQTDTSLSTALKVVIGGVAGSSPSQLVHGGTFDNAYLNSSSPNITGFLYVCGITTEANASPALYRIGFDGTGAMNTSIANGPLTMTSAAGSQCSPITEFYNGGTDRIFLGITANGNLGGTCSGTCSGGACLYSFDITSSFPTTCSAKLTSSGGTSGIIIDNSASGGGSELYFTPLTGSTGAVQASQAGLN
jgi:hypothetical protein